MPGNFHWQLFTSRGLVSKILFGKLDLNKLEGLDKDLTKIMDDMKVPSLTHIL